MTIRSFFYDSVNGDRPYSASDFARAFDIVFENGILPNDDNKDLGFDIGGASYTTIYSGKAVIQGRFVEVIDTETITVPTGTYSGQIVLRIDIDDNRNATIVCKTERSPTQTSSLYEYPLYDVAVTDGIIQTVTDVRTQGGVSGKANTVKWEVDTNGVRVNMGKFGGTGKPVVLFLTSAQPAASSAEHRVWIQIDNF